MGFSSKTNVWIWVGLAATALLFATESPAQVVSFVARRDFAAGGAPQSVAVGDFNGDGVLVALHREGDVFRRPPPFGCLHGWILTAHFSLRL